MFNPFTFASPKQQQEIIKVQKITKNIRYVVHTEDNESRIEFTLVTDNPEAKLLLPQLREGIVTSVTQMLYTLYGMEGERI